MRSLVDRQRRAFLGTGLGMLAGSMLAISSPTVRAQATTLRPDPKSFQSGDLVWPKKPGAFVPYRSDAGSSLEVDRKRWIQERADFILEARRPPAGTTKEEADYLESVAAEVERLTFEEFYHGYAANVSPDTFIQQGGGSILYVGHVAIVDVDTSGEPWLVEAILGKGTGCEDCVHRIRYADWLAQRGEIDVWHARLKNLDSPARAKVVEIARKYVGRPYKFWRFDLSDESGFYCSKLAWLSVIKATGLALDDDRNPRRKRWYSPLQMMKSPYLERLHWPGNYRIY